MGAEYITAKNSLSASDHSRWKELILSRIMNVLFLKKTPCASALLWAVPFVDPSARTFKTTFNWGPAQEEMDCLAHALRHMTKFKRLIYDLHGFQDGRNFFGQQEEVAMFVNPSAKSYVT